MTKRIEPQETLDGLLARKPRPERIKNLRLLHEICAVQAKTSFDFSLATIGKLSESRGGISYRALYNASSSDYRSLIAAWQEWCDRSGLKPKHIEARITDSLLLKIDDPAVRGLIQGVLSERDRLRAELNLLKSSTILNIDLRAAPQKPPPTQNATPTSQTVFPLTNSERDALSRAVSSTFLAEQGWAQGALGEVKTSSGRLIYWHGYVTAIKKTLNQT